MRSEKPEGMRVLAAVAAAAGAGASLVLMLRAGHRNPSRLLILLFVVWVLSPFAALVWAGRISTRWSGAGRAMLYGLVLILAAGSVLVYGNVIPRPPGTKPAFVFLMVPLASWLLIAAAAALGARTSRRRGDGRPPL